MVLITARLKSSELRTSTWVAVYGVRTLLGFDSGLSLHLRPSPRGKSSRDAEYRVLCRLRYTGPPTSFDPIKLFKIRILPTLQVGFAGNAHVTRCVHVLPLEPSSQLHDVINPLQMLGPRGLPIRWEP